jgi:hypothetical protein
MRVIDERGSKGLLGVFSVLRSIDARFGRMKGECLRNETRYELPVSSVCKPFPPELLEGSGWGLTRGGRR